MKTLYLDCGMGAAGDMLTAALLELLPDQEGFVEELNRLGIPGVQVVREHTMKCGIHGTHMRVLVDGKEEDPDMFDNPVYHHKHRHGHGSEHDHEAEHTHDEAHAHDAEHAHEHGHVHDAEHTHDEAHAHDAEHAHAHHHNSMKDIEQIIEQLTLPSSVRQDVMSVYKLIAEAESRAHGKEVSEIHFHEVGAKDAIADIVAVCLLINKLAPDEIVVSPVHVGGGHVKCAHGIMPVPAPATAYILQGLPIYGGSVQGELCTPTGAALLRYFASRFGDMPMMITEAIGYGMGKKDFERANCVRAFLGETVGKDDKVYELSCNVDDMTAEEIGFAMERFFDEGALEVYTIPVGMKKSRPGTLIRVMCKGDDRERMVRLIYKYTTTIGVRETETRRYVLERSIETVDSPYGVVHYKKSTGYGVTRIKYEYDDLVAIARKENISIEEVRQAVDNSSKNNKGL